MKGRGARLYAEDILQCMEKIEKYLKDMSYAAFEKNDLVVDAVLRNLEVIGEAAKNVPAGVRKKHPEVPWKKMVGLRNIAIHEYFGVDKSIIWEIATKNLPETKRDMENLLKELQEP
jgi:uncharacterized protein with HEPN domain